MSNKPSTPATIEAICSAFGGDAQTEVGAIHKEKVLNWMNSNDLQVRGCICAMICNHERAKHIEPPLTFEDYYGFVVPYFEQCIEENPALEWVDSRYIAGHDWVRWILDFWKNESVPRTKLDNIKQRLSALYKRGDDGVRDAVLNSVLEHLFEDDQLVEFFGDWRTDPVLSRVYRDAQMWRTERPKAP